MAVLCEAVLVLLLRALPMLLEVQRCACDEGVRRYTQVRAFLESLPAGAVVADVGCGNGAHTLTQQKAFTIPHLGSHLAKPLRMPN